MSPVWPHGQGPAEKFWRGASTWLEQPVIPAPGEDRTQVALERARLDPAEHGETGGPNVSKSRRPPLESHKKATRKPQESQKGSVFTHRVSSPTRHQIARQEASGDRRGGSEGTGLR